MNSKEEEHFKQFTITFIEKTYCRKYILRRRTLAGTICEINAQAFSCSVDFLNLNLGTRPGPQYGVQVPYRTLWETCLKHLLYKNS